MSLGASVNNGNHGDAISLGIADRVDHYAVYVKFSVSGSVGDHFLFTKLNFREPRVMVCYPFRLLISAGFNHKQLIWVLRTAGNERNHAVTGPRKRADCVCSRTKYCLFISSIWPDGTNCRRRAFTCKKVNLVVGGPVNLFVFAFKILIDNLRSAAFG